MSNSVVKVTDSTLSDSLFLLVGEDGTVTPSKDVVESYLSKLRTLRSIEELNLFSKVLRRVQQISK